MRLAPELLSKGCATAKRAQKGEIWTKLGKCRLDGRQKLAYNPTVMPKTGEWTLPRDSGRPFMKGFEMGQIELVCASPQMRRIAETIRRSRGRTLLLTGETGVGKDALARWAHTITPYAEGPFIGINCAAIQDPLWESEIFGHVKGAFTGALKDKPGQIERAEGGTLFLNEIGDMPLSTQAKLLTFLDTHEFQRVGETKTRSVKTRVMAATNHDLEQAIEAGKFRQDLFYRLAIVHARIPPLRERPEDILALAELQLHYLIRERKTGVIRIAQPTQDLLVRHRWKGNARELYSVIETAFEQCVETGGGTLLPEHFAPELSPNGLSGVKCHEQGAGEPGAESAHLSQMSEFFLPGGSLLKDPKVLRTFLDQFKTPSGRWNLSAAHRRLVESGRINIRRRAFAEQVKKMFPDE